MKVHDGEYKIYLNNIFMNGLVQYLDKIKYSNVVLFGITIIVKIITGY